MRGSTLAYWVAVIALLLLGYLAAFSIGGIFWLIALAMILLAPFRSRSRLFRTGAVLFAGFLLGFVLVSPFGCSQTFDSESGAGPIVCRSITGIEYPGPEPTALPAVLAGVALGLAGAAATWRVNR